MGLLHSLKRQIKKDIEKLTKKDMKIIHIILTGSLLGSLVYFFIGVYLIYLLNLSNFIGFLSCLMTNLISIVTVYKVKHKRMHLHI